MMFRVPATVAALKPEAWSKIMQFKKIMLTAILPLLLLGALQAKPKALSFDNPGNRRLLKNEDGSFYYYRSLPEKGMKLNVAGIDKIELRSFAVEPLNKPQAISIVAKKQSFHDLKLKGRLNGFYIYESVTIPVPEGTKELELVCYDRGIYFRAFWTPAPKPKPAPKKKLPNLAMEAHSGILAMTHNGSSSDYYSFTPDQPLRFTINNDRAAVIYVRARLLDRSIPAFDVYINGQLVQTHEFTLKRSTTYAVTGIRHLSVGKKVELPARTGKAVVELKAKSDHLFLGRPVILKAN